MISPLKKIIPYLLIPITFDIWFSNFQKIFQRPLYCRFENGLSCLLFLKLSRASFTGNNSKILMCYFRSLADQIPLSEKRLLV